MMKHSFFQFRETFPSLTLYDDDAGNRKKKPVENDDGEPGTSVPGSPLGSVS
jgi:hypothetical protein